MLISSGSSSVTNLPLQTGPAQGCFSFPALYPSRFPLLVLPRGGRSRSFPFPPSCPHDSWPSFLFPPRDTFDQCCFSLGEGSCLAFSFFCPRINTQKIAGFSFLFHLGDNWMIPFSPLIRETLIGHIAFSFSSTLSWSCL